MLMIEKLLEGLRLAMNLCILDRTQRGRPKLACTKQQGEGKGQGAREGQAEGAGPGVAAKQKRREERSKRIGKEGKKDSLMPIPLIFKSNHPSSLSHVTYIKGSKYYQKPKLMDEPMFYLTIQSNLLCGVISKRVR